MSGGRDSVDGIATSNRLDGPGFERRGGEFFRTRTNWPRGTFGLLHDGFPVSFSGLKWPGIRTAHPPPSKAGVEYG